MARRQVTVDVVTPQWQYCDIEGSKRGKKSGERCRFCMTTKERGQGERHQCLLFNVELAVKADCVVKTPLCYTNWKKNQIVDLTQNATVYNGVPVKEVSKQVKQAVRKVKSTASTINNQGIPLEQAIDLATQIVLDDWK